MKPTKSVLESAKAFLCWEEFPGLSIQLVAMREAVSYYYPPAERSSIIVFYDAGCSDFTRPTFHLFHEAGHHARFLRTKAKNGDDDFRRILDTPTGPIRTEFEQGAWEEGRRLFLRFLENEDLDRSLIEIYDAYAKQSIATYDEGPP